MVRPQTWCCKLCRGLVATLIRPHTLLDRPLASPRRFGLAGRWGSCVCHKSKPATVRAMDLHVYAMLKQI